MKTKKNLLFLLLISTILCGCAQKNFFKEKEERAQEEKKENPLYYQQWFNEHKNEKSEIPLGMTDEWAAYDKKIFERGSERGESNIKTVTNLANTGNHGGRTRSILVSSLDSNRIFVGSVSGGLWRSDDAGSSWKPINDQAANLSVTCITENPFNPNEIYYGTGEVRGGTQPPGNGVYKSIDGGMTFNKIASSNIPDMQFCNYMNHSLVDSSTVWLGTSKALYKTTNNGTTWSKSVTGSISGIVNFPDSSLLVSTIGGKIYRSPKGVLGTFSTVADTANIFPKNINGRILIANCKNVPNVVYSFFTTTTSNYYGEGDRGIFRSNDGGISWTKASTDTVKIGSTYQSYCQVLGVHASKPDFIMVGGVTCKYSKNAGKTWNTLPIGHSDNHDYTNFGKNNEFLIGCDGGVFKHTWDKITTAPKDINKGYTSSQYYAGNYAATGASAVGGTQDNGTWRYTNGVLNKIYGADGAYSHISQQNVKMAYVSTQNGSTYRMDNYLTSTNTVKVTPALAVAEGVDFINEHQINYADGNQLYYKSAKGIWRTTDKGAIWDRLNANTINNPTAIGVTNEQNPTVYAGGTNTFYRIDSAATAEPVTEYKNLYKKMPASIQGSAWGNISFHPKDPHTMYVTFSSASSASRIWKVDNPHIDTMMSWTDLGANLPKNLSVYQLQPHPDQPDSIFFAATSFGLYYTTDAGKTWEKETRVPNVAILELKLRASDKTLFLFTHGRGVWYLELKDLQNTVAINDVVNFGLNLFPNPATHFIRINTDAEIATIQIFDLQGRVLIEAANETEIPISSLPNGFYVLKIYDKKGRFVSKKFLKS
jgi:photosystem II stability/assembly factor-like uncharacterized protein